ncbi:hypothetical protein HZF24_15495 [Sedimentibacter hydroxybenzoicus DSM 7310]|uniref:Uncharacterized protein n=1 Tax=Sedimentibacter hydroxybenzoicus DSM 7310 TaxID=1123245 RepID=A0A974BM17_SEDHY|nr:hypothetical protein [Sedimentibacter hydroxybenzoicus]NYB75552.1 hypothetical protein [Sedimentibacter hydroxybenzoicus DSM 7310]
MKSKKVFSYLTLAVALLLCFSVNVYGASANAILLATESSTVSSAIGLSTYSDYSALNSKDSAYSVYANVQCAFPGKSWKQVESTLMAAPGIANGTNYATENANWRLELNPWGWGFIGCSANGIISYD